MCLGKSRQMTIHEKVFAMYLTELIFLIYEEYIKPNKGKVSNQIGKLVKYKNKWQKDL